MLSVNTEAKHHFATLDALRGVAALSVVICHWLEGLGYRAFGTSWLAVDFFFMLSGFVVAYSYEERLKNGFPLIKFILLRVVRLYPMIVMGAVLGLIRFEGKYFVDHHQLSLDIFFKFITTLTMVPESVIFSNNELELFTINIAFWSLFFEFIAYFLFALFLIKLKNYALSTIALFGFIGVCFWFLACFGYEETFGRVIAIDGFFRVIFSFSIGIILYRTRFSIRAFGKKLSCYVLLLLPLLFVLPRNILPWYIYPLLMISILPLGIIVGINNELKGRLKTITSFLGDISYPLYAIHTPLLWMIGFLIKKVTGHSEPSYLVWFGLIVIPVTIGLSFIALKVYDEPVRIWLKKTVF